MVNAGTGDTSGQCFRGNYLTSISTNLNTSDCFLARVIACQTFLGGDGGGGGGGGWCSICQQQHLLQGPMLCPMLLPPPPLHHHVVQQQKTEQSRAA